MQYARLGNSGLIVSRLGFGVMTFGHDQGAMGAAGTADRLLRIMTELRARRPAVKSELDKIRERRARRAAG